MKTKHLLRLVLALLCTGLASRVMGEEVSKHLLALAWQATSADSGRATSAINQLRAAGPVGMQALSQVYSNQITKHQSQSFRGKVVADDEWVRLHAAFDAVGEQRDAYASGLYWYTNLDQAIAVARASGKPILSLRLLGRLDEEYSCANSRFFRTTLYPNAGVSKFLRDNFVLHWQSERPVPHITIDMGDGRRIERTITGNSIHYVLDKNGNLVDALPGLYSAPAFMAGLGDAIVAAKESAGLSGTDRRVYLQKYHAGKLAEIRGEWARDLVKIGDPISTNDWASLQAASSDETWPRMAALHPENFALDANTVGLIYAKEPHPDMASAMRLTTSKAVVETPMMRMINNLQRSISEDTVRNEYQFHYRIHEWLASPGFPDNLAQVNRRIYADLFLTPESDPWLGMVPTTSFSALDRGGLVQ